MKKWLAKILNRWSWKLNPEYFPVARVMIEEKVFDMKILRTKRMLSEMSMMRYPIMERQMKDQAIQDLQKEIIPYITITKSDSFIDNYREYDFTLFVGKRMT